MTAPELGTLGRYTLKRVLGKGAMGVVYEGLDPRLNRRVAIKTILKSHLDDAHAKDFALRFEQEAKAVARLNHPNIVQVHDFGEEGSVSYLVMEFVQGRELKSVFDKKERAGLQETVRIMGELLDALEYAHRAGVIHRDIKPGNVMLDAEGRSKLTDFGVARVQDLDQTQVAAGTMVGTPAYMSPEQISGVKVDRRTDLFAAGVILYQFLTGQMPFTGGGAWSIAKKIMNEDPPAPSSIDPSLSPLFDAVVKKALAKKADQRYQSAGEFGIALRSALEGKASKAAPAAASQSASQAVELEFWLAIKDGNDPIDFELYLEQFPSGTYADLARRTIEKLRQEQGTNLADEEYRKEVQARKEAWKIAQAEKAELLAMRQVELKRIRDAELQAAAEAAKPPPPSLPPRKPFPVMPILIGAATAAIGLVAWFVYKL